MNRRVLVGLAVVAVAVGAAAAPRAERKGVLAVLEPGQQVGLKETPGGYQISVMTGVPLGHKVLEVGPDYVVLQDAAGLTETRIPVTAVRAVVVTRVPKGG